MPRKANRKPSTRRRKSGTSSPVVPTANQDLVPLDIPGWFDTDAEAWWHRIAPDTVEGHSFGRALVRMHRPRSRSVSLPH
jgi:hypothetical protein